MPRMASLRKRLTDLIPELAKFGVVGLTGAIIDLGGADYLHVHLGIGPMVAKALSITAATVVTYLGSRFWTFRHRVNQALLREGVLFVMLNVVGLAIAEVVIAVTTYGLDISRSWPTTRPAWSAPGSGRSSGTSRTRSGSSWRARPAPWWPPERRRCPGSSTPPRRARQARCWPERPSRPGRTRTARGPALRTGLGAP